MQSLPNKYIESLPNKYIEYFKQFIVKITQKPFNADYNDFLKIYEQVYNNQTFEIHPIFTKCQISDVQLQLIQNQIKEMKEIYSRLQTTINKIKAQGVKIQYQSNVMEELKFQTFLARNKLNNQCFFNTLKQQHFFQLEDPKSLLKLFNQILKSDYLNEQKITTIKKFIQKNIEGFSQLDQQYLTKLINFMLQRNKQLQYLISKLSFISPKMIINVINYIFSNDEQTPNPSNEVMKQAVKQTKQTKPKQTQQQFSSRVSPIVKQKLKQFNMFNATKKQLILTDLFNQRQKGLNKDSIINVIKKYFPTFNDWGKIDQLLIKVYQLKDVSELNRQISQQNNKSQQVKQSIKLQPKEQFKQHKEQFIQQEKKKEIKVQAPKLVKKQQVVVKEKQQKVQKKVQKNVQKIQKKAQKQKQQSQQQQQSQQPAAKAAQKQSKKKQPQSQQNAISISSQPLQRKQLHTLSTQLNYLTNTLPSNQQCFETLLRQLIVAGIQKNQLKIRELCQKVQKMLGKYGMADKAKGLDNIKVCKVSQVDRVVKMKSFRQQILPLNVIQISLAKNEIQSSSECQNADAIIIIGITGAGKSTFIVGGSGFKLQYIPQTQDYKPVDKDVAKKYVVSNLMVSETRKPNLSVVLKQWVKSKHIIIIDTPGLGQNRSCQIDITNVISTISMLKRLKSARVVIALTKHQFDGRCFQSIKTLIKSISSYLFKIDQFTSGITFIYSKGLTQFIVSTKLKEFLGLQQFRNINWQSNELEFIQFLKQKFIQEQIQSTQSRNQFQIIDPSKHNYKKLIKSITDKSATPNPGTSIASTFTQKTLIKFKQTIQYLQQMIQKTFEFCEFKLTLFYLKQLEDVQKIQNDSSSINSNYQKILNKLANGQNDKLQNAKKQLQKFYLHNDQQHIVNIKQIKKIFQNLQQEKQLMRLIFSRGQNTPLYELDKLIKDNLAISQQKLLNASQIPKDQRKQCFSALLLIKQLLSESKYQKLKKTIQDNNKNIQADIIKLIKSSKFTKQNWQSTVQLYKNQFQVNGKQISQSQSYQNLRNFVKNYLDGQVKQFNTIKQLLKSAETQTTDGNIQEVCQSILTKLKIIKQTNYCIKQVVEPKMNSIINQLQSTLAKFQKCEEQALQSFNGDSLNKCEFYQKNSEQINNILQKFNQSSNTMHIFIKTKTDKKILKKIQQKNASNVLQLQRLIDQLSQRPQNFCPQKIAKLLTQIFQFINLNNNRRKASKLQNEKSLSQSSLKVKKNDDDNVAKIKQKIRKTANNTNIECFKLNYKLIMCLFVARQFQKTYHSYFGVNDQEMIQIAKNIQTKLLKPLQDVKNTIYIRNKTNKSSQNKQITQDQVNQITTNVLEKHYYEKLLKTLGYLKELDDKAIQFGRQARGFQFTLDFQNNPQIIRLIQSSFKKTIQQFQKLTKLKRLINFQEQQQHAPLQQKAVLLQQKQTNLLGLSLGLCTQSAKFILSYTQVKKIVEEFFYINVVEEFKNQSLEALDLEKMIEKRLLNIDKTVNDKILSVALSNKQLKDLNKQFKFLDDILSRSSAKQTYDFSQTQKRLTDLMSTMARDFEIQLKNVEEMYKQIKDGSDFQDLRRLLELPLKLSPIYTLRITNLYKRIDNQFRKQMQQMKIGFDPKGPVTERTNVFINIYQFLKICQDNLWKQSKIQKNLLQQNCNDVFTQLKNAFQQIIKQVQICKPFRQKDFKYLIKYQRRISLYMRQQFSNFLKRTTLSKQFQDFQKTLKQGENPSFQKFYSKRINQIKETIQLKYLSEDVVLDSKFGQFIENAPVQKQKKMKQILVKKIDKKEMQLQQCIKTDHSSLNKQLQELTNASQFLPNDLRKIYAETIVQISKKVEVVNEKAHKNARQAVKQNKIQNLFDEYLNGQKLKSDKIKQLVTEQIKNYPTQVLKQTALQSLSELCQVLKENRKLITSQKFTKVAQQCPHLKQSQKKLAQGFKQQIKIKNEMLLKQVQKQKEQKMKIPLDKIDYGFKSKSKFTQRLHQQNVSISGIRNK